MLKQGQVDEAIKGYRALVKRLPLTGVALAQLLIGHTKQRPALSRDWSEVERLLDDAAKSAPESVEPVLVRAELALAKNQSAAARDELEKARSRFPKSAASGVLRLIFW